MSSGTYDPNTRFLLTPQQQNLLYAALNSNKQAAAPPNKSPQVSNPSSMSPDSYQTSPVMDNGLNGAMDNSFLPNFDYGDFGDSSFDFSFADDSQASLIGDIPGSTTIIKSESSEDNEVPSDKRAHPDDEEDEADNGNDPKRRESTDKLPKKPGRKPLTSEPTSKRKAQNRAAQRAFRERKEKHLKDLETKVDELQKASDAANNENGLLRAQVEKMTNELKEYQNRFSLMRNRSASGGNPRVGLGAPAVGNLNDVNFQFEFPKFGVLPGPNVNANTSKPTPQKPASSGSPLAALGRKSTSPPQQSNSRSKENSISPVMSNGGNFTLSKDEMANFSAFFDPALARASMSTSRASMDSAPHSLHNGTSTSSPSASSQSNGGGPSSSCGTSPEPFTQSPMGFKPVDTMTTIGEEQSAMNNGQMNNMFGNVNSNSFDWLAQQNGGSFDPQLFGDYREPQDNILSTGTFDDAFFNEAYDADFFLPYNTAISPNIGKKDNLIDQIDAAKNADDFTGTNSEAQQKLNCTQVFSSLSNCPKVQSGEFDLDGLCSELQKKAKCSGDGPTVSEVDFQAVVNKWMGKETADCVSASLSKQA